jgi:hypothetical protein
LKLMSRTPPTSPLPTAYSVSSSMLIMVLYATPTPPLLLLLLLAAAAAWLLLLAALLLLVALLLTPPPLPPLLPVGEELGLGKWRLRSLPLLTRRVGMPTGHSVISSVHLALNLRPMATSCAPTWPTYAQWRAQRCRCSSAGQSV